MLCNKDTLHYIIIIRKMLEGEDVQNAEQKITRK